ncbi:MAG: hypothetical protein WAT19_11920 [Ferruginibacter sp.]
MKFSVPIKTGNEIHWYWVVKLPLNNGKERFKVTCHGLSFELENNRLLLRKKGLRHRSPTWQVYGGNGLYNGLLDTIYKAIWDIIESPKPEF